MGERVLVVVAHPDDETLGCGGTLTKHIANGDTVMVASLSSGVGSRDSKNDLAKERIEMYGNAACILGVTVFPSATFPDNRFDDVAQLDICKAIEWYANVMRPTIVYTHWPCDLNIDHRITSNAVMVACRPISSSVKRILFMEVAGSTEWSGPGHLVFAPNYYVNLDQEQVELKQKAMRCYTSEIREQPHPRSLHGIQTHAQWRGMQAGVPFAEAFVLAREVV